MTEEELRKGLMLLLAHHYNGVDFVKPHVRDIAYRASDKILILLKEAGWKSPEDLKKEHLETPWQRYVDEYYRDKGE